MGKSKRLEGRRAEVSGLQSVGLFGVQQRPHTHRRGLRGTQIGTEGRRILSQGQSNERTGQGTTKYASADGAVRYDVVRVRARDGTGRVGSSSVQVGKD